ncbi:MAG: hypothetical protein HOQ24_14925 [Mycobacteriaceae bacterium]|nr:hypothetical protein [Mycobacteriaceae bacterium]
MFDRSFSARMKTLLRTEPIHQIADVAGQRAWADAGFDLHTLCLAAIDAVVSRQRLPEEATYAEVLELLGELARRAVPGADQKVYAEVATYVVDGLLNTPGKSAPFGYDLIDYARESAARRVEFTLLYEREQRATGTVVLNATVDAINALIGGLDCDVEDEQAAVELVLDRQLKQGKFDQAQASARMGSQLSIQYFEELSAALEATRRDVRSVDWREAMPQRLARAIDHVGERLHAEARLLEHVRAGQSGDGEASRAKRPAHAVAAVVDLLEDCRTRHTELHSQLIDARDTFLDEQVRQRFRPPASLQTPDLAEDVLHPVLRGNREQAEAACEVFAAAAFGPCAPRLPRISRLVDMMLSPRVVTATPVHLPDDPGVLVDPPASIDESAVEGAVAAVASIGLPARLSTLVSNADDAAARLIVYAALWAYAPSGEEGDQDPDGVASRILGPTPVVTSDGTALAMPKWCGDDLVVAANEQQTAEYWLAQDEGGPV